MKVICQCVCNQTLCVKWRSLMHDAFYVNSVEYLSHISRSQSKFKHFTGWKNIQCTVASITRLSELYGRLAEVGPIYLGDITRCRSCFPFEQESGNYLSLFPNIVALIHVKVNSPFLLAGDAAGHASVWITLVVASLSIIHHMARWSLQWTNGGSIHLSGPLRHVLS